MAIQRNISDHPLEAWGMTCVLAEIWNLMSTAGLRKTMNHQYCCVCILGAIQYGGELKVDHRNIGTLELTPLSRYAMRLHKLPMQFIIEYAKSLHSSGRLNKVSSPFPPLTLDPCCGWGCWCGCSAEDLKRTRGENQRKSHLQLRIDLGHYPLVSLMNQAAIAWPNFRRNSSITKKCGS